MKSTHQPAVGTWRAPILQEVQHMVSQSDSADLGNAEPLHLPTTAQKPDTNTLESFHCSSPQKKGCYYVAGNSKIVDRFDFLIWLDLIIWFIWFWVLIGWANLENLIRNPLTHPLLRIQSAQVDNLKDCMQRITNTTRWLPGHLA